MICFAVGAPTLFSDWCEEICARLITRVSGRPEVILANTLEEVALAVVRARGDNVILQVRLPAQVLRAALVASGRGFLVIIDDPCAVFSTLITGYGFDPAAAARTAAANCAMLVGYAAAANAAVLRSNQHAGDASLAAPLIAEQLGLPLSAADVIEAVADVPPFAMVSNRGDTASWSDEIARSCPEFAIGALQGYRDYFADRGWSGINWDRHLFFRGDDPGQPADEIIALAGGARVLLFGPYIALPAGNWRATVTLAVSKEAVGMRFRIEVLAGPLCSCLIESVTMPDEHGVCRLTLPFLVTPETDQPICLRLSNMQPAAQGRLALVNVALDMRTGAEAVIPAELSAALVS